MIDGLCRQTVARTVDIREQATWRDRHINPTSNLHIMVSEWSAMSAATTVRKGRGDRIIFSLHFNIAWRSRGIQRYCCIYLGGALN